MRLLGWCWAVCLLCKVLTDCSLMKLAEIWLYNAGYNKCKKLTPSQLIIIWVGTQGFAAWKCLITLHNVILPLLPKYQNKIIFIWSHIINRHQTLLYCVISNDAIIHHLNGPTLHQRYQVALWWVISHISHKLSPHCSLNHDPKGPCTNCSHHCSVCSV